MNLVIIQGLLMCFVSLSGWYCLAGSAFYTVPTQVMLRFFDFVTKSLCFGHHIGRVANWTAVHVWYCLLKYLACGSRFENVLPAVWELSLDRLSVRSLFW